MLSVPPHARAAPPSDVVIRRILCPMDFSSAALQAFGFAMDLARRTNASVTVLYVIEWLPEEEPRSLAHFNVPEYRQYLTLDARERLEALIAQESPVVPPRLRLSSVVRIGKSCGSLTRESISSSWVRRDAGVTCCRHSVQPHSRSCAWPPARYSACTARDICLLQRCTCRHGLLVRPYGGLSVSLNIRSCETFVLPGRMAPAARKRATASASAQARGSPR